jgi:hypothetical protein
LSSLDEQFQEYFSALERAGSDDRCFLCRRTPSDVKAFFGFHEDGTPMQAEQYGLEDVVLERQDIMSYRAVRPVCAVCQLAHDMIFLAGDHGVLSELRRQMEEERDKLWPRDEGA